MKPLILFDIDGTLSSDSFYDYEAHAIVAKQLFGIDIDPKKLMKYGGLPERPFLETVLKEHGIDATTENINKFLKGFEKLYIANIGSDDRHVLLGAKKLLLKLKEKNILCGVITGNTINVAFAKLEYVGLGGIFNFGGYTEDSFERCGIIKAAIEKAKKTGVEFDKVFVVGDTHYDVEAAKKVGVKIIAVATGQYSTKQLSNAGADFVLDNLEDVKKFLEIIGVE
jgi:phosphoglycolate phosphatase